MSQPSGKRSKHTGYSKSRDAAVSLQNLKWRGIESSAGPLRKPVHKLTTERASNVKSEDTCQMVSRNREPPVHRVKEARQVNVYGALPLVHAGNRYLTLSHLNVPIRVTLWPHTNLVPEGRRAWPPRPRRSQSRSQFSLVREFTGGELDDQRGLEHVRTGAGTVHVQYQKGGPQIYV